MREDGPDIRRYEPQDLRRLYEICLQTGATGNDASGMYDDSDILGHFYVGPYAALEPVHCFVLTRQQRVHGYIAGVEDSDNFSRRCEQEWFPSLRRRYPLPTDGDQSADANIIRAIHRGHEPLSLSRYPAHLHINLLPEMRGQGFGQQLVYSLFRALQNRGVTGIHLAVGPANTAAIGFYEHLGFRPVQQNEKRIVLARRLGVASVEPLR